MKEFHFVDYFLQVTEDVESPTSFLIWSALAAVGAVLRDNIWYEFPERRTKIHPNLGVLLIARSASARKSTPLKIVSSLIKSVENTKVIEGRATLEGVAKTLSLQETNSRGQIIKDASGILYAEELKAFLNKSNAGIEVLTDFLDYHDIWDYVLMSQDKLTLKEICVSILAASNEVFLKDIFTEEAIKGGLAGRLILVHEYKARKKHSGMFPSIKVDWTPLESHLMHLSKIKKGPIKMSYETKKYYDDWYNNTDFDSLNTQTGFEGRMHTHILKVALCEAACEPYFDGQLKIVHLERALDRIRPLQSNYKALVMTGAYKEPSISQAAQDILMLLLQMEIGFCATAVSLRQKTFGKITNTDIFNKAIDALIQSDLIIDELIDNKPGYRVTQVCLNLFSDVVKERGKGKETVQ